MSIVKFSENKANMKTPRGLYSLPQILLDSSAYVEQKEISQIDYMYMHKIQNIMQKLR